MEKRQRKDTIEYFYFTVDEWTRKYSFEVNGFKWEFSPHHHAERDEILIAGRLRNKTKRKFTSCFTHLWPSFFPREE